MLCSKYLNYKHCYAFYSRTERGFILYLFYQWTSVPLIKVSLSSKLGFLRQYHNFKSQYFINYLWYILLMPEVNSASILITVRPFSDETASETFYKYNIYQSRLWWKASITFWVISWWRVYPSPLPTRPLFSPTPTPILYPVPLQTHITAVHLFPENVCWLHIKICFPSFLSCLFIL